MLEMPWPNITDQDGQLMTMIMITGAALTVHKIEEDHFGSTDARRLIH